MSKRFNLGNKCFVIAEISANHGQNFNRAVALIKEAKKGGADAVKFQTYTADTITLNSDASYFRIKDRKWGSRNLYQLYKKAYTPWSWFRKLKNIADDLGILFFSTAFDKTAVDFLEELKVPVHKIASFELVDLPLIEYMAKTGKPLILSTGMANLKEIKEALETAKRAGAKDIILLRCISDYPAEPQDMNLNSIPYMAELFKVPIGLSDHTRGITIPIVALTLGAKLIEKHFTLSRKLKTPDSFFSLEAKEFKDLVDNIRIAQDSLGEINFGLSAGEKKNKVFRRSLFAVKDVKKGDILTEDNVRSIRPAFGLAPKYLKRIIGKISNCDIKAGAPLGFRHIER